MFLKKDKKGYYRLFEWRDGKQRYVKYLGRDPQPFLNDLARGKDILGVLQKYPDLALKGGQAALAEYKRRLNFISLSFWTAG